MISQKPVRTLCVTIFDHIKKKKSLILFVFLNEKRESELDVVFQYNDLLDY